MKAKVQTPIIKKSNYLIFSKPLFKMTVLVLILSITTLPSFSQTLCLTKDIRSKEMDKITSSRNNSGPYYVKIYIHVIRRTNGTGGQSDATVDQAFSIMSNDFSGQNIHFVWDCSIDYIDDDNIFTAQGGIYIFGFNPHSDGIDIYLFPDYPGTITGNANAISTPGGAFYISGSNFNAPFQPLTPTSIMSHEMGHCLGLHHTFSNFCGAQLVNDPNCTSCGDRICDTPADPGMNYNVDGNTCQWLGSGNDPNGDPYNPDESLIMAYTYLDCMSSFTAGQGQRMRDVLASILQNVLTTPLDVGIISGPDPVYCGAYFNISPVPGAISYTWSWQGGCGSVYGTGLYGYLYSNCGFGTGGLLCVNANFSCPSVSSIQRCRTLSLLPCGYLKKDNNDIESRSQKIQVGIYPNPATNNVTIEVNDNALKKIELIDINGTIIHKLSTVTNKTNLDISNFNSGIYFVRIILESGEILTQKFLVSN